MNERYIQWLYSMIDTFFSIIRMIVLTKFKKTKQVKRNHDQCMVMGNGPSLTESLTLNKEKLSKVDLVAVNFMALSSEYIEYKPNIYVLCDPAFWFDVSSERIEIKVRDFYFQLVEKTNWGLQVYIPYQASKNKEIKAILSRNPHIRLCYYNKTKFEGNIFLSYLIYDKQWGIPRAENVIVAALMLTVYSGYKEIYLAGADSDYVKNMWVDENNEVRFNDYHFYKDSKKNTEGILLEKPEKIHKNCLSIYYMFKSYIDIEKYSVYRKTKIYNTGLYSFIDAFEKKVLI